MNDNGALASSNGLCAQFTRCDCDIIWRFQLMSKLSLCIDSAPVPGFRRLSSGVSFSKISPGPSKNNGILTKSEGNFVMELDELGNVDIDLEAISRFLAVEDWFWFMYTSMVTI